MHIVVDYREAHLIHALNELVSKHTGVTVTTTNLSIGDISIRHSAAETSEISLIERKSFSDLLASIKDGRYEEQSHRLIHTTHLHKHNILYLVEGVFGQLHNPQDKKLIMSSIISLNLFKGFSVYRTSCVQESAEWIMSLAVKMMRDFANGRRLAYAAPSAPLAIPAPEQGENTNTQIVDHSPEVVNGVYAGDEHVAQYSSFVKKVKKDNITPENIGEILLCQIPHISSTIASEIMREFKTFPDLVREIQTSPEKLQNIRLTTNGKSRKIPKNVVENVLRFLRSEEAAKPPTTIPTNVFPSSA